MNDDKKTECCDPPSSPNASNMLTYITGSCSEGVSALLTITKEEKKTITELQSQGDVWMLLLMDN